MTAREQEVLQWIAEGKSNWEIGQILACAEETVKKHLHHIFRKLGVDNRTSAAAMYWRWRASITTDGNSFPHIAQASE